MIRLAFDAMASAGSAHIGVVIEGPAEPAVFTALRENARRTIVDRYDLKRVCLPGQLRLLKQM